jgi:hypothetical protein
MLFFFFFQREVSNEHFYISLCVEELTETEPLNRVNVCNRVEMCARVVFDFSKKIEKFLRNGNANISTQWFHIIHRVRAGTDT